MPDTTASVPAVLSGTLSAELRAYADSFGDLSDPVIYAQEQRDDQQLVRRAADALDALTAELRQWRLSACFGCGCMEETKHTPEEFGRQWEATLKRESEAHHRAKAAEARARAMEAQVERLTAALSPFATAGRQIPAGREDWQKVSDHDVQAITVGVMRAAQAAISAPSAPSEQQDADDIDADAYTLRVGRSPSRRRPEPVKSALGTSSSRRPGIRRSSRLTERSSLRPNSRPTRWRGNWRWLCDRSPNTPPTNWTARSRAA